MTQPFWPRRTTSLFRQGSRPCAGAVGHGGNITLVQTCNNQRTSSSVSRLIEMSRLHHSAGVRKMRRVLLIIVFTFTTSIFYAAPALADRAQVMIVLDASDSMWSRIANKEKILIA